MEDNDIGPFHEWGDDFDFDAIDAAGNYLSSKCRKYARLGIWTKEKYGTLRVSLTCAFFREFDFIHHLFYPGHAYYRLPKWFRKYVDWPIGKLMSVLGIVKLLQRYQTFVLKHFWKKAATIWPHVSKEILDEYELTFGEKP